MQNLWLILEFIAGLLIGWWVRSRVYRATKLPEINRLIEVIGEGINVGQADPDAPNPYATPKGADAVETLGFSMGFNAGKLFHENMKAFEVGERFKKSVLMGWRGETPAPAVSWLKQCYDAGADLRHGKAK
jgi:hypothetical protein